MPFTERTQTSAPKRTKSGQGAELEAVKEKEAEKEKEKEAAAARRRLFESWNAIAAKLNLPLAKSLTEKRSARIDERFTDPEFAGHWQAALARLPTARFALGLGSKGWRMSFDDFLNADKFLKLTEGGYDNLNSTATNSPDSDSRIHSTEDRDAPDVTDVT